jgi:hypothetical protein
MLYIFHAHSFFATFSPMPLASFHDYGQHFCHEPALRTFWPSLFTLAASHVNQSEVYLSSNLFH